jgi:hypothetical protein
MVLTAHVLQAVQVRLKYVTNEGNLTLEDETVYGPTSSRMAVVTLKYATEHYLSMRYVLCKSD